MPKIKPKKRMTEDRKRQVATTKARHGKDWYSKIATKSAAFRDPVKAQEAAFKRWHPEWFDDNGKLIPQEERIDGRNERGREEDSPNDQE